MRSTCHTTVRAAGRLRLFGLLVFGVLASPAPASDAFSIRFDDTVTDESGNRQTLKGNVVVEAGNIRFEADQVIQHLENGVPVKFEATGSPVMLTQSGQALQGLEKGTSESLVYLVKERTLLLTNYELRFSGSILQRGKQLTLTFE
jgi:lipopolysaccharide transport protein LptA